jgi:predicted DsbA family dithiol-disulfide isomerase
MKRFLFALAFVAAPLFAADVNNPELMKYASRAIPQCPNAKIRLTTVEKAAPKGFNLYGLEQTSSDERCGMHTFILHSPASGQVVFGVVYEMKPDYRPLATRVAELATQLLRRPAKVEIEPYSLPDGLMSVRIIKPTDRGELRYQAFVDSEATSLIVGRRGSLKTDPRETLLTNIGAANAMTRGNKNAKVKILELSDFQCPTCSRAHEVMEKFYAKNKSAVSYSRLDLPLIENHDWTLQASLAARAIQKMAPAKYWEYVDYIFSNQGEINAVNVERFIKGFVEDHEIDWKKIEPAYRSASEKKALIEQASRMLDNQIFGTPTFIVNGQAIYYMGDNEQLTRDLNAMVKGSK